MAVLRARIAFALAATLFGAIACATAELKTPPAALTGPSACAGGPQIACEAGAAAGAGCQGAPAASTDASGAGGPVYAVGCRALFLGPDCSTESTCVCDASDGSVPHWACD